MVSYYSVDHRLTFSLTCRETKYYFFSFAARGRRFDRKLKGLRLYTLPLRRKTFKTKSHTVVTRTCAHNLLVSDVKLSTEKVYSMIKNNIDFVIIS